MKNREDAEETIPREPTGDEITLPPHIRKKVLRSDNHSCCLCGDKSKKVDGNVHLHVHHKEYDPDEYDVNDQKNLTTLCTICHSWFHSRPEPDDFEVELTNKAIQRLVGSDLELLKILSIHGPTSAEEIAARAAHDPDLGTVKQRLYAIMGVDTVIEEQPQIVDKDAETGEWGLAEDIETSERQSPNTIYDTVKRTRDKIVQHAMEADIDPKVVAKTVGIHKRQCYLFMHRARAYDFDIEDYTGRGRPPKDGGGKVTRESDNIDREDEQASIDTDSSDAEYVEADNTKSNGDSTSIRY